MMEVIIDYRKVAATAVTKDEIYIVTKSGQKKIAKTTVGKVPPSAYVSQCAESESSIFT